MNFNLMDKIFLGNTLLNYLICVLIFLATYYFLKIIKTKVLTKLSQLSKKTETKIDDAILNVISQIKTIEYFIVSFYISLKFLKILNHKLFIISKIAFLMVILYRVVLLIDELLSIAFENITESSKESEKSIKVIRNIIKTIIWLFGALFLLHNIGININSLLAGLGIGGVAIALAAQTILKDIFNFFVILLDKPFKVGDFISIPSINISGNVEEIGLKSTKIRTLQGEIVIVTNSKISEEVIQNFSKMKERRIIVKVGVTYKTSVEKLKQISNIIENIIKNQRNVRFERVNFIKFSDSSLDFEFVYYILSPDYNEYIRTNEKILLEIVSSFEKNDIEFAYPTQTIYIKKEEK